MSDIIEAYKRLGDEKDDFDISFWQAQGPEAIFEAAMQMILDAELIRNDHVTEPRLDRTVESFQRL